MIPLVDPRWASLHGGYDVPYDASIALRAIEAGAPVDKYWDELWGNLHHQGDVGQASYATVAVLVDMAVLDVANDWNLFALALTIEHARTHANNQPVAEWIKAAYENAWTKLLELAINALKTSSDALVVRMALAVVATSKGLRPLGRILSESDESELADVYAQFYGDI